MGRRARAARIFAELASRLHATRVPHLPGTLEALRIDRALIDEMAVLPDFRYPDNLRLGVAPLYTSYADLHEAVARIARVVRDRPLRALPVRPPDHYLGHLGVLGAMGTPYDYQTDWTRVAHLIVHDALRMAPGERVLIHADPTYFPALTEAVRIEVNRAGAVEVAVHMLHPPGLERARKELRRLEDPASRSMEDRTVAALFGVADVYIWLPTSWAYNVWQTEEIIKTWPGRAVHFHWIMDVSMDAGLFRRLSELYDAALWIDYSALTAHQRRVASVAPGQRDRGDGPAGNAPPVRAAGGAFPSGQRRRLEGVHRRLRAAGQRPRPRGRIAGRSDPDGRHPADRGRPGHPARGLRGAPGRERAPRVLGEPHHPAHQPVPRRRGSRLRGRPTPANATASASSTSASTPSSRCCPGCRRSPTTATGQG